MPTAIRNTSAASIDEGITDKVTLARYFAVPISPHKLPSPKAAISIIRTGIMFLHPDITDSIAWPVVIIFFVTTINIHASVPRKYALASEILNLSLPIFGNPKLINIPTRTIERTRKGISATDAEDSRFSICFSSSDLPSSRTFILATAFFSSGSIGPNSLLLRITRGTIRTARSV